MAHFRGKKSTRHDLFISVTKKLIFSMLSTIENCHCQCRIRKEIKIAANINIPFSCIGHNCCRGMPRNLMVLTSCVLHASVSSHFIPRMAALLRFAILRISVESWLDCLETKAYTLHAGHSSNY